MSYTDTAKKRVAQRRWMRDYRARKQAQGLCIYGGCWSPIRDFLYCWYHREKRNARDRERSAANGNY